MESNKLLELVRKINSIEDALAQTDEIETILSGKTEEEIKELISNLGRFGRIKLIKFFSERKDLYNIEDYLQDFLKENKNSYTVYSLGITPMLSLLRRTESIDNEKLMKSISENFGEFNWFGIYDIINGLEEIKEIQKELDTNNEEKKESITNIRNMLSKNMMSFIRKNDYSMDLICAFRSFGVDISQFAKNQDDIINNLSGSNLLRYIQQSKENEGFNKEWTSEELVKQIWKNDRFIMKDEVSQKMLSIIISEICVHEKISPSEITLKGEGSYSLVLKIGEYILKVGEDRESRIIPNDKRVLKPLIRQQTNTKSKAYDIIDAKEESEGLRLFIEVQNNVDEKWYEGLSENEIKEELYKIYAELRDRRIVWTDVKKENAGRLIKPNRENFISNNEELKSDKNAIGFEGEEPNEILQPGELVIIDTDFLYYEGAEEYSEARIGYQLEFEKRYIEERKLKMNTDNKEKEQR